MLKMKKILSVALVVVMLFGMFALNSSAIVEGKEVGLILKSDKTEKEIVPGARVTVTLHFDMADYNQLLSDSKICILYDKNVYKPDLNSRKFIVDLAGFADDETAPNINAKYAAAVMKVSTMTEEEKALYNSGVMQQILAEPVNKGASSEGGFSVTKGADGISVGEMTIAFDVIGDEAALASGNKNIRLCDAAKQQTVKKTDGVNTPVLVQKLDASRGDIMSNMPAAPAGPAVTKAKSQVKMTATGANTVADEFSFRVISKISDSDWDTYFKNTGVADATTDYITAVGMVAYKGAAAFDADTAKRVVAGESVADYTAATTDYISKVNDTADAEFGAIIKANHSTLNNDVTYMGFVQYVDASGNAQTIFYETAGTAALSTNYNNIVSAYLARYPFAA